MTARTWEDCLNPTTHDDVLREIHAADQARAALIEQVREELRGEEPAPWDAKWAFRLRREMDLTQREFGSMVGVTSATIRSWEKGHSKPALELRVTMTQIERTGGRV